MQIVTPFQMRKIECVSDELGNTYSDLMESAGFSLAEIIKKYGQGKKILFLCGNGNNAGDCFAAIRYLFETDFEMSVALLCGNPKSILAVQNYEKIKDKVLVTDNYNEIISLVENADIICDGVFGTGFHGGLSDSIKKIFSYTDGKYKIAVDVASGGDCLNGNVSEGTFKADVTLTFGLLKTGMTQYPLKEFCGKIIVADIGITDESIFKALQFPAISEEFTKPCSIHLTDDSFIKSNFSKRKADCHKGNFGKLLTVCGSNPMSGACVMAGKSALRCGVGTLTTASTEKCTDRIAFNIPESMTVSLDCDENGFLLCEENLELLIQKSAECSAMLIGCGLGVTNDTRKLVYRLVKNAECPLIIDADGINCISNCIEIIKEAKCTPILTPHPKEFSRLINCDVKEVQSNRVSLALKFAVEYNCAVILKGAGTIIATPETLYINNTGNSGMSKGGSGDVLAGMVSSFVAQGYSPLVSAVSAVYFHGLSGDLSAEKFSQTAMLPTDMIDTLGEVFKKYKL